MNVRLLREFTKKVKEGYSISRIPDDKEVYTWVIEKMGYYPLYNSIHVLGPFSNLEDAEVAYNDLMHKRRNHYAIEYLNGRASIKKSNKKGK